MQPQNISQIRLHAIPSLSKPPLWAWLRVGGGVLEQDAGAS